MKFRGRLKSIHFIVLNIICAAVISSLFFIYFFSPYKIIGNSMLPGLIDGEKIIISNSPIIRKLDRFDIVVFNAPGMGEKKLIKRIIGLPGEKIEIRKGRVLINNKALEEHFLKDKGDVIFNSINMDVRTIPGNHFFLLGDYREHSTDSREFGSLHRSTIVGRLLFRYWPIFKLGIVK